MRKPIVSAWCVAVVLVASVESAHAQPGGVLSHKKISATEGDFGGRLNNDDRFGRSVASLGDLDVCAADLNRDGLVDPADLAIILGNWGPVPPNDPIADFTGDGVVDSADLAIVLANWGPCV